MAEPVPAVPGAWPHPLLSWAETRHAAKVLRKARLDARRMQQDVAAALGWKVNILRRLEHAQRRMTRAEVLAIAGELGVPAENLEQPAIGTGGTGG